jgi:hypothetical protein
MDTKTETGARDGGRGLTSPKVIEFPGPNLQDIPAMLESLASQMRSGEVPTPDLVILVAKHGLNIAVIELGKIVDGFQALGVLQAGVGYVTNACFGETE